MHAMSMTLDPKSNSTLAQRAPFEGGYQFGDVSRQALRESLSINPSHPQIT